MKVLLTLTIVALSSRFIYGAPPLPQDKYPAFVTNILDQPTQNMKGIKDSRDCGESSEQNMLVWRMEDCENDTQDDDSICSVSNEVALKTEVDFRALVPSTSIEFQYFLSEKNANGQVTALVHETITSDTIYAGMTYTFHRSARVPEVFQGKMLTATVILVDVSNDYGTILCASADFFVNFSDEEDAEEED